MPSKKQSKKLLESGYCTRCGKNQVDGRTTCDSCQAYTKDYDKHKWDKRLDNNLCAYCGKNLAKSGIKSCQECCDKRKLTRKDYKIRAFVQRQDRKLRVIEHYGGECLCCGESILLLLTIDHISGDGAKHRRQISPNCTYRPPEGDRFYRWVEKNNYPTGLQTLCYNCNIGKHRNNGVCPHQTV